MSAQLAATVLLRVAVIEDLNKDGGSFQQGRLPAPSCTEEKQCWQPSLVPGVNNSHTKLMKCFPQAWGVLTLGEGL